MNTCLIKSGLYYLHGTILLSFGYISGRQTLRVTGYQKQIDARCQLAIGSAQKIIKQCIKRQASLSSVSHIKAV